jgi:hypothetical protein
VLPHLGIYPKKAVSAFSHCFFSPFNADYLPKVDDLMVMDYEECGIFAPSISRDRLPRFATSALLHDIARFCLSPPPKMESTTSPDRVASTDSKVSLNY